MNAIELFVREGRKERQELANRIQRPELVYNPEPAEEPQSITWDSDEEFWAAKENGTE